MQLSHMTWQAVEAEIAAGAPVMLPVGSTEQHGPMGRIGTDTICARAVAMAAANRCGAVVAPALAYTPAPFNTSFAGTVSVPADLFCAYAQAVCHGLLAQGFAGIYVVNGHGANLAPLKQVADQLGQRRFCLRSWWEPQPVQDLRRQLYGDWEGMHATPSEIAMTQALLGVMPVGAASEPPQKLTAQYLAEHAGDRHGPPAAHRAAFPDGRVGSHSALARPEHGTQLIDLAAEEIAAEFTRFRSKLGGAAK